MRYYLDGPSYDASRVVPRNLTGFAPGKWQEPCPSQPAKTKGLENLSTAADHGRQYDSPSAAYKPIHGGYPNEDLSGRVHPEAVVMDRTGTITREIFADEQQYPSIYFDAVKLMAALRETANAAQKKAWQMEMALKDYRQLPTQAKLDDLKRAYQLLNTPDMKEAIEIEDMIHTIDQA